MVRPGLTHFFLELGRLDPATYWTDLFQLLMQLCKAGLVKEKKEAYLTMARSKKDHHLFKPKSIFLQLIIS